MNFRDSNLSAGLLVPLLLLSCAGEAPPAERRPDVLFLTVDTLRADHLGFHGYPGPTSPQLDKFARESVVFENAIAQSSWTLASLASLMTSHWVGELGIRDFRSHLPTSATTLAEVLSDNGYETGAVGSHLVFLDKYGLRQGIADFDDELVLRDFGRSHRAISSKQISDKGLAWMAERRDSAKPWFLWLHYFDPHVPYQEHPSVGDKFGTSPIGRYDGEIAFTDAQMGRVLRRAKASERPLVVVFTADHGEEFNDHGKNSHGHTLYQELIHVPLFIRGPGLAPASIPDLVRLVDVMPTLFELLRIPLDQRPTELVGQSLLPLTRGDTLEPQPSLSELRFHADTHVDALIRGRWKLIVPRTEAPVELYDLEDNRKESKNLAERRPKLVESLREQMDLMTSEAWTRGESSATELELDPDEIDALQGLGYMGDDEDAADDERP